MQSPVTDAGNAPKKRGRLTLLLILAVCAAPLVASYTMYFLGGTAEHVNYGDLIEPRPLTHAALTTLDGQALPLAQLKGQWVLLTVDDAGCDARCREKLVYLRQVRLAQGREAGRISRLWLVSGGARPDAALLAEHEGLTLARDTGGSVLPALPAARTPSDHIYVIDPLGNLMMRFPADPDPRRMLKDVARLLRHSKWR
jgi:hypothetical protein